MNAETVMLLLLVIPIVVCLWVGVVHIALVIMTNPHQYTDEEEIKRMMEW